MRDAPLRGATDEPAASVEAAYRASYGRVLASVIRFLGGDFDAAEEAVADAFVAAVETWGRDGIPDNPAAWLTTAAQRRALDRLRRRRRQSEKLDRLARELEAEEAAGMRIGTDGELGDDRLRLIFTCCHPALPLDGRLALTLRTVCGLTTAEIARAFLVSERTLSQRLVRAKRKIQAAGIPYRVPAREDLPERLDGVLATIYLVFNEGYLTSSGPAAVRHELCDEAINLAALVADLLPEQPEAHGLAALLLLNDSRRRARLAPDGSIRRLDEQDRALWDGDSIARGMSALRRGFAALRPGEAPGRYLLQAAIAAEHARTVDGRKASWGRIAELYGALAAIDPSPVVELNRAVAVAEVDGVQAGLELVDRLVADERLAGYHLLNAARADMLRRAGRAGEAAREYRRAIDLAENDAERTFLLARLASLDAPPQR